MCILYAVRCTMYNVQCTFILYTHFIYTQVYHIIYVYNAMHTLNIYIYTGYTINICCVKCIHYKYIVDVLRKTIRRIEMIDHSFERKFYGACYYRLY